MTRQQLIEQIKLKRSFLCVGLDSDPARLPEHLLDFQDPVFEFNKAIIDATHDVAVAYKPNIAFYESRGSKGWDSLKKTLDYIPKNIFTIADAKRGDIGNTSRYYASAFFEYMDFDSVTVAPYMGEDSVTPFLEFREKWVILLALTSNKGANDFQFIGNPPLHEQVITKSQNWGSPENLMYVVGATRPDMFQTIRNLAPEHFLLVPGVGAQGGSVEEVARFGMNKDYGLLVNSSRGIIFADSGENYAQHARTEAIKMRDGMSALLG